MKICEFYQIQNSLKLVKICWVDVVQASSRYITLGCL